MKNLICFFFLTILSVTFAADKISTSSSGSNYVIDNAGKVWPAIVNYSTDGNGNVIPINTLTSIGTAIQGAPGLTPWLFDLSTIFGAAPSATNYVPMRLTDGTGYYTPLTDTQLRASAVPVSAAALPLPSGASTSALQTTANATAASIDGKLATLGQKAMAGSVPVTFASDQSALTLKGGTDGTLIANVGGKLRVSNKPYIYDIAAFSLAGHTPIYLLGKTSGVGATRVDVWESATPSVYVFPTAPIQMQVVSSSASDSAAGTGVRTVDIEYLDNTYTTQTTTITLNGVTPVLTVPTNMLRVNGFHTMTVGTNGVAVGNISLQSVGGATTYSRIALGTNFARQVIYTVPAGKTLYLVGTRFATTTAATGHTQELTVRSTSSPTFELTPGVFMFKDITLLDNNAVPVKYDLPIAIPATADVKATCQSDGANAAVCVVAMEGWIE